MLLLSYIQALIYHDRSGAERDELREVIIASVRTDLRRKEVETMTRTIADELREEGQLKGEVWSRQQILIRLLWLRFGRLSRALEQVIRDTDDLARLDTWLDGVATAQTLDEIGISR
jgi:hypothetical protein